ncbi:MAG: DUF3097 family protein [Acidimicrobiales bacterium]
MRNDGILAGDFDIDQPPRRRGVDYPNVAARLGLVVEHSASGTTGAIVRFAPPQVVLRDRHGRDTALRLRDGAFSIDGRPVALRPPPTTDTTTAPSRTTSGSVALDDVPARVARASRLYVEGIHDGELIEKVWGDDLRVEGVVVEVMDGADDLTALVRGFGPGPNRRLGILLDHLVDGSKEHRLAATVDHPDVQVAGHPFVDVWQVVKPSVAGLDAWPDVPHGESWKEGVLGRIGHPGPPGAFWKQLLGRVETWTDLEPVFVGAVESLIDFVAPPER